MAKYALGLDFGTESARAVLVEVATGEMKATAVQAYTHGVIDKYLPDSQRSLPSDWALQDPSDWLEALQAVVPSVLKQSKVQPDDVIGLGIDFTSCTILPTTISGTPLSEISEYRNQPHAWAKLWKHHAAQAQADRVNAIAAQQGEPWLERYGKKISSEWMLPKALQILEEAPEIYQAAARIIEGADWVVWQLTGQLTRNTCCAGYKATWHKAQGFPSENYLSLLDPRFRGLYREKLAGPIKAPGSLAGNLSVEWASRLGLSAGMPVAVAMIDAHAGMLGGGASQPGILFMVMGTSTCHMMISEQEVLVEGISGVVEDGIVPGFFGYEAGQASVGDIFAWFIDNGVPPEYHAEAKRRSVSLHDLLAEKAAHLRPGESGLLALDWWNGCRSTLVNADLSGMLVGATLTTRPEEIYRALIEATAYGTRVIIDAFTSQGIPVERVMAGGGLTKNSLLMQIYADVTGHEMVVSGSDQASALGAAILGAVAAGPSGGGYASIPEAVCHMAPRPAGSYRPKPAHLVPYRKLFDEYYRLYQYFGRENPVMKNLRMMQE